MKHIDCFAGIRDQYDVCWTEMRTWWWQEIVTRLPPNTGYGQITLLWHRYFIICLRQGGFGFCHGLLPCRF